MYIVFDESSIDSLIMSVPIARSSMTATVMGAKRLVQLGFPRDLRVVSDILYKNIAQEYKLIQWINDKEVDVELRRYFKSLISKGPNIESVLEEIELTKNSAYEFNLNGQKVFGIGVGVLTNAPVISAGCNSNCNIKIVNITITTIKDEDITTRDTYITIYHCPISINNNEEKLLGLLSNDIRCGTDIVDHPCLTNLEICAAAKRQLKELSGNEPYFHQVIRHLLILNSSIKYWSTAKGLTISGMTYSEESSATLNHPRYGEDRKFLCPDGQRRQFSLHSKPTGGNIRIYFFPIGISKKAYIGYVGRHLPSVEYPT